MSPVVLRLRELRLAAGLTQQELADVVKVRQATISDLENGRSQRVELALVDRLAKVLDVAPGELFARTKR